MRLKSNRQISLQKIMIASLISLSLTSVYGQSTKSTTDWTAGMAPDPILKQPRCLLRSNSSITSDGYNQTPVTAIYNGEQFIFVTQSTLDKSFGDLHLTIDKNIKSASDKIVHDTLLVFDQNMDRILENLRKGHQLTVYLRFWPTYPVTQSFPIRFDLKKFNAAYKKMNTCNP